MSAIDTIWYGDSPSARAARVVLTPASWLFRAAVGVRDWRIARLDFEATVASLPVLSIGNVTVGGTGKTPLAAWAAASLRARGGAPAVLMRGYGDDEPIVHTRLNPDVPVIVGADRAASAERARAAGADCVVLDDGFQHRQLRRVSDWVLVAAEGWRETLQLLPAGPLREPLAALSRADVVIVTRKSASRERAEGVALRLSSRFPRLAVAAVHLAPDALVDARTGMKTPLAWIDGKRLLAVAAIGNPAAFVAQLQALGAHIESVPFRDHHAFTTGDVRALVAAADRREGLVCTLKDVVKLAPRWPAAAAPLWYVSQNALIERGNEALDRALEAVLAARQAATSTAGAAGPSSPSHGHRSSTADR